MTDPIIPRSLCNQVNRFTTSIREVAWIDCLETEQLTTCMSLSFQCPTEFFISDAFDFRQHHAVIFTLDQAAHKIADADFHHAEEVAELPRLLPVTVKFLLV